MTMPLPRTLTNVFAVPRSMPISSEKRPRSQSRGLTKWCFLLVRVKQPDYTTPPGASPASYQTLIYPAPGVLTTFSDRRQASSRVRARVVSVAITPPNSKRAGGYDRPARCRSLVSQLLATEDLDLPLKLAAINLWIVVQ